VGGKLTFFGIDYGKSVNWEMKDATGSKQKKDWIDLLFEVIREKDKSFSLSLV
jgi:hypothetical protein